MAFRAAALAALAFASASAAVTLTANTTQTHHLGFVSVTWDGLSASDASSAWLGVFYPSNASVSAIPCLPYPGQSPCTSAFPAKWILCSQMPGCSAGGSGSHTFELINSFTDAKIVLFTGGLSTPKQLASTAPITFVDASAPLRGHIARTREPSEMLVVWHSAQEDDAPTVRWGYAPGVYTSSAPAVSTTYTKEDLCGPPATTQGWFPPFYWQYARITGLPPSTVVYYSYGSQANGWSQEDSFISAPAPGPHQALNLITIADMGQTEWDGSTSHWEEPDAGMTTAHARNVSWSGSGYDYSLLLHVGDLSYATGYELKWDLFLSRLNGLATHVPYMIGQGNHERDFPGTGTYYDDSVDSGGECGVPTQVRFPSPVPTRDMQDEGFWALAHGPLTVIMLNTELELAVGSQQYDFVQRSLAAVNRSVTPWVFVAGHRPMYYVDEQGSHIDAHFAVLEPLFVQYEVDLFLVGHVHNAFVSCPVINGTCQTPASAGAYAGPIHACIGNAGQGLTPINTTGVAPWVDYQVSAYGYSTINIASATSLSMQFYADETNELLYNFTLERAWPRV